MTNNVLHILVHTSHFSYAKCVFRVTFLCQRVSLFDSTAVRGRVYNKLTRNLLY